MARLDLHLRLAVFRRDGYCCSHCGVIGRWFEMEVDHVRPLSWGGTDDFVNLQTLCISCNRRKGARFSV